MISGSRLQTVELCAADEVPPGSMKVVPHGKYGVGVFNIGGVFYALLNYCPHQGAPVCLGSVSGSNEYDADEDGYVRVLKGRVLRCPWHQWEFDITTGNSLAKPARRVKTYPARVENGKVVAEL